MCPRAAPHVSKRPPFMERGAPLGNGAPLGTEPRGPETVGGAVGGAVGGHFDQMKPLRRSRRRPFSRFKLRFAGFSMAICQHCPPAPPLLWGKQTPPTKQTSPPNSRHHRAAASGGDRSGARHRARAKGQRAGGCAPAGGVDAIGNPACCLQQPQLAVHSMYMLCTATPPAVCSKLGGGPAATRGPH